MLKVTFLGTGTSQGVPVIACHCETCLSTDNKDKRLRSSILLSMGEDNIVIDVGPDFRQQMLQYHVKSLGAILLTHEHNDHVAGLDDIRPFNFRQRYDMPLYGLQRVLNDIQSRFAYIFNSVPYPGVPKVVSFPIEANQTMTILEQFPIEIIGVQHGSLPILGFRIFNFAYITDASFLDQVAISQLKNLDILVINALQFRKHYSHYSFDEAIKVAQEISAKMTYLTHMSHELGRYEDLCKRLPSNIRPAYDGLVVEVQKL
jgi:phosphoribosyl 1,2-cyclic phosphate phosphodiesterase